ncbi:methyltransferase domain-containing protein [Paenibacillus sp. R14(2021)]|uniref:MerR family transcriptional regulator n=1 Tax=Paenibacillus sp. R14(2021) TaxID=2859228 RepID=UPI001C612C56|nr:methyltransferase domain-containing protein [Paenibacillus sp. R14(2021)]
MRINDIAIRLGVTPRAIRLYESKGLLKPQRVEENGYRVFSDEDAWRLQTISSLRGIGLGLGAIKAMIEKLDHGDADSVHHHLELQRMALVSKWVEWGSTIEVLDQLIARAEAKGKLDAGDLFELTERLNEVRLQQGSWLDAWRFDELADRFDRSSAMLSTGSVLSQADYDRVLDFIAQWTAPQRGEHGLDVGAGTGNLSGLLVARGARLSAVDQSKEMLARCRDKLPDIEAKLGNAMALPYLNNRFAFVVSAFAFHYMNEAQQLLALGEMDRVLKPNGRICIAGLMTDDGAGEEASEPAKYPSDRRQLIAWFQVHGYITVHHAVNPWIGILYAVRKY